MPCHQKDCNECRPCGVDSARHERFRKDFVRPEDGRDFIPKVTEAIARPLAKINEVFVEAVIEIVAERKGNPTFNVTKKKNGDVIIELTTSE